MTPLTKIRAALEAAAAGEGVMATIPPMHNMPNEWWEAMRHRQHVEANAPTWLAELVDRVEAAEAERNAAVAIIDDARHAIAGRSGSRLEPTKAVLFGSEAARLVLAWEDRKRIAASNLPPAHVLISEHNRERQTTEPVEFNTGERPDPRPTLEAVERAVAAGWRKPNDPDDPEWFEGDRAARAVLALLPGRPESVVKAEALRDLLNHLDGYRNQGAPVHTWTRDAIAAHLAGIEAGA